MNWLPRRPLTWMLAAELVVVAALGLAVWHLWQDWQRPPAVVAGGGPVGVAPAGSDPPPTGPPRQPLPRSSPPAPRATPGMGSGTVFLAGQLDGINRDQAAWEGAQWRLLSALTGAMRDYLERVVVPAVERAGSHPSSGP